MSTRHPSSHPQSNTECRWRSPWGLQVAATRAFEVLFVPQECDYRLMLVSPLAYLRCRGYCGRARLNAQRERSSAWMIHTQMSKVGTAKATMHIVLEQVHNHYKRMRTSAVLRGTLSTVDNKPVGVGYS